MNRRSFTRMAFVATVTALGPTTSSAASLQDGTAFGDLLDVEVSRVRGCHVRAFQLPASSSPHDQRELFYWVVALGFVAASPNDIATIRDAAWPSVPSWYVASSNDMVLGPALEAGLGGQTIGDGVTARYWDVSNSSDPDEFWRQFALGCVATWSENRLLMLWGCAADGNPVVPLLDLAATSYPGWDTTAASLLPSLAGMPVGMVLIDDGPLDLGSDPDRPDRFGSL
jgi:hypothetical protein